VLIRLLDPGGDWIEQRGTYGELGLGQFDVMVPPDGNGFVLEITHSASGHGLAAQLLKS
jgi:hypothetical protein